MILSSFFLCSAFASEEQTKWDAISFNDVGNCGWLGHDQKNPQVIVDRNGNTIIVWEEENENMDIDVWVAYHAQSEEWVEWQATFCSCENSFCSARPRIAADDAGNITLVCQVCNSETFQYTTGTAYHKYGDDWSMWQTHTFQLESNTDCAPPEMAIDCNGNVTIVWEANDQTDTYTVWAAHHSFSESWDTWQLKSFEETSDDSFSSPSIGVDEKGDVTVAWLAVDSDNDSIWVAHHRKSDSWEKWDIVKAFDEVFLSPLRVSVGVKGEVTLIGSDGDAIYLMRQSEKNDSKNWLIGGFSLRGDSVTKCSEEISWDERVKKIQNDCVQSSPSIVTDSEGNVIVVWVKETEDHVYKTCISYHKSEDAWERWSVLHFDPLSLSIGECFRPKVALDNEQNVTIVWDVYDGKGSYATYFAKHSKEGDILSNWITDYFERSHCDVCMSPELALDQNGKITIVWMDSDAEGKGHVISAAHQQ